MTKKNKTWPTWRRDDKSVVSCTEKIKVMSDNFDEIQQIVQDAFEAVSYTHLRAHETDS